MRIQSSFRSTTHVVPETAKPIDVIYGLLATVGALGAAAAGLFGRPLREALPQAVGGRARSGLRALRSLHSGHIGDYIAWWTAGAGMLGGVCLVALR